MIIAICVSYHLKSCDRASLWVQAKVATSEMPELVSNNRGEPPHLAEPSENITWKDRIVHFTWSWFSCTMSTGAIAVLLASQPFTFTGLETIGKIFFIFDLVRVPLLFWCVIAKSMDSACFFYSADWFQLASLCTQLLSPSPFIILKSPSSSVPSSSLSYSW